MMKYLLTLLTCCCVALARFHDSTPPALARFCRIPEHKRPDVARCTYSQGTRIPDIRRHCVKAIRGDLIGLEDTGKFLCKEANHKEFQFISECFVSAVRIYDKRGKNYSKIARFCAGIVEGDSPHGWQHSHQHE